MATRPLGWSDLTGARVGVWGLGVEGQAAIRRLARLGVEPVAVDDHPPAPEVLGRPVHDLAGGGFDALKACQVVVKAPGVSRYRPEVAALENLGVAVVGGLALWLEEVDRRAVACVTGTKGKSTTVALCGHLLSGLGVDAFVGGNLGLPPYDPDVGPHPLYIVETSSFQAADATSAPPVVAVTSLAPDHLDWHGDVATYYRDKLSLCTKPGARLTVANASSPELRAHAADLGPKVRWVAEGDEALEGPFIEALSLPAAQRVDALLARAVLEALGVAEVRDDEALAQAAAGFNGLESRFQTLGRFEGVTFIDDSLSTNALSALAALASVPVGRLAVIVGGQDRGVDYHPLVEALLARADPTLAVALPGAGRRIAAALVAAGPSRVVEVDTMDEAVAKARRFAEPDGVVLLSPAAPSFGQFRNYRDRSAAFRQAVGGAGV